MPWYILNQTYHLFWCTAIHSLFQIDRLFLINRHGSSAACGLLSVQPTRIAQQRKVSLDFKSAAGCIDNWFIVQPLYAEKYFNDNPISTFPPCYVFQMIWPLGWFSLQVAMSVIGRKKLWKPLWCMYACMLNNSKRQ